MIIIQNNPELSDAFRNSEVKEFFKNFLHGMEGAYSIKDFLTKGADKFFEEQMAQLAKSFRVIEYHPEEEGFLEVERSLDGSHFKVGDVVTDLIDPERKRRYPIGRLYEDDRGLHVRLDYPDGSITWRDLGTIEH